MDCGSRCIAESSIEASSVFKFTLEKVFNLNKTYQTDQYIYTLIYILYTNGLKSAIFNSHNNPTKNY